MSEVKSQGLSNVVSQLKENDLASLFTAIFQSRLQVVFKFAVSVAMQSPLLVIVLPVRIL